jgi:hypothetical protein
MFPRLVKRAFYGIALVFLCISIYILYENFTSYKFFYKEQSLTINFDFNFSNRHKPCILDLTNQTDYVNQLDKQVYRFDEIEAKLKKIKISRAGISYASKLHNCSSNYNVALIVPYRNRLDSLKIFLNNIHVYLSEQKVNYGIYLIEPLSNLTFNRGLLMNIGYEQVIKHEKDLGIKWNCFIFHDVDLLPEDKRAIYMCDDLPTHFAVSVSSLNYEYGGAYLQNFGGITAFNRHQFKQINGFSNKFFGWGGEDNDLYTRSLLKFKRVIKLTPQIGRFFMVNHAKEKPNPNRFDLLRKADTKMRWDFFSRHAEGLSTLVYRVEEIDKNSLFTRFYVSYNENDY